MYTGSEIDLFRIEFCFKPKTTNSSMDYDEDIDAQLFEDVFKIDFYKIYSKILLI